MGQSILPYVNGTSNERISLLGAAQMAPQDEIREKTKSGLSKGGTLQSLGA